jgi:UDP-N-acetylmuramoylalanine--D-glutamate ligase
MSRVEDQQILVLGLARSGLAAARLLKQEGAIVRGSDLRSEGDLRSEVDELRQLGVQVETGGHSSEMLRGTDFVVVSPGIPDDAPILGEARKLGIAIYSELEVASWWARAPMVAVTGSNGKTTTTTLLGRIFQRAGRNCQVAGNIGFPLSAGVRDVPPEGILVVEVSSFQLQYIESFHPRVGVILNITPDHLDRHRTMEAYAGAKARLLMNQTTADTAVLNHDDPRTAALEDRVKGALIPYSIRERVKGGVFVQEGEIISALSGAEQKVLPIDQVTLPGPHNLSNALAAVAAARALGVDLSICARELTAFKGLEHRLELVRVLDGVRYVNDSKATNVEAVEQALLSYPGKILLIAGGRDKDADFSRLSQLIGQRVRWLILLGEAREKMERAWGKLTDTRLVGSLEEAIRLAQQKAQPGETVLLSPACASFDMFRDFEDRGNAFKKIVERLTAANENVTSTHWEIS